MYDQDLAILAELFMKRYKQRFKESSDYQRVLQKRQRTMKNCNFRQLTKSGYNSCQNRN